MSSLRACQVGWRPGAWCWFHPRPCPSPCLPSSWNERVSDYIRSLQFKRMIHIKMETLLSCGSEQGWLRLLSEAFAALAQQFRRDQKESTLMITGENAHMNSLSTVFLFASFIKPRRWRQEKKPERCGTGDSLRTKAWEGLNCRWLKYREGHMEKHEKEINYANNLNEPENETLWDNKEVLFKQLSL